MASLGIRYTAAGDCLLRRPASSFLDDRSSRVSTFPVPKLAGKSPLSRISTAATMTPTPTVFRSGLSDFGADFDIIQTESFVEDEEYDRSYENHRVSDKIDEWMKTSVTEIVKNIRQAPLLVQIYANGVVKTEKAVKAEDWPNVVMEQPSSSLSLPDGIILVEELRDKTDLDDCSGEDEGSKAFGVVIQGKFKGRDRVKSGCYLLKTCSVNGGIGPFCTHFCLMKVRSFSKSASSQLNDCWLLP